MVIVSIDIGILFDVVDISTVGVIFCNVVCITGCYHLILVVLVSVVVDMVFVFPAFICQSSRCRHPRCLSGVLICDFVTGVTSCLKHPEPLPIEG